jgi:inhibitor of KinA sporulation pathway (predicted exonuclease)
MNFYIDFEANQFSNRIISIGCVSESEQKFFQLCKPSKKGEKITSFITELTGITQEAIDMAKTADEVFTEFFDWVDAICYNDKEIPEFYCYGNSDKDFLQATVEYMINFKAITMVNSLIASMKDYTKILNFEHPIGLIKLYNFLLASEIKQNHNSLEDAKMLSYIAQNKDKLSDFTIPKVINQNQGRKRKTSSLKTESIDLKVTNLWAIGTKAYEADTKGTEENYEYKGVGPRGEVLYFDSIDTVISWIMSFGFAPGRKMKNEKDIKDIYYTLIDAINKNEKAYRMKFTRKESDI